jgi:deazaflavin-dependent oxidoreductase (nitroreductase family)
MKLPTEKPAQLDTALTGRIMKLMSRAHVALYRATNGRVGSTWRIGAGASKPVPTLLLDHRGRKSGKHFTTPLLYLQDGPALVVVASQGGRVANPQWYENLVAHPDTTVQTPRSHPRPVRARTADAQERARLWPRLVELYADFDNYQRWAPREIPVVILEPR